MSHYFSNAVLLSKHSLIHLLRRTVLSESGFTSDEAATKRPPHCKHGSHYSADSVVHSPVTARDLLHIC
jgi:hypothetical protein